jgi:GntR family carbon starvation induced transcriptional regulator
MLTIGDQIEAENVLPRSQASFAYESIRGDIISGRHKPTKKLKIQDLAIELKVSPGAVREALSRLVPEQLVMSWDQRGFAVAPLSVSDLEDLTDLRCEIEAIALRRSIERGDIDWEAGLIGAAHRLRATPLPVPGAPSSLGAGWISAHAAFHYALVAACGSKRLLGLHVQLYEQSERYRGLSGRVESKREINKEHQEIVDLALARNADGLVQSMTKHLRVTTNLIVNAARKATLSD